MAITPLTGFKALEFDGEASTDYGVQILGEGVFNAPKREVQMISIPGRNGEYALDKGRFENIDVKYPAHLIADSTTDFAEAVSDFRNMLCSRRGYCRLTDDYHPEEYRMAVYKSGLEVDEKVLRAGKFNIVFDCKPQRWLTSGEEAVTVADGEELTNPTLHEASPLLEVKGHGTVGFNGYAIELDEGNMGYTEIESPFQFALPLSKQLTSPLFNSTDEIQTGIISIRWGVDALPSYAGFSEIYLGHHISGGIWSDPDEGDGTTKIETVFDTLKKQPRVVTTFPVHLFSGDSATTMTDIAKCEFIGAQSGDLRPLVRVTANITITYTPSTQTLSVTVSGTITNSTGISTFATDTSHCNSVYAYSTVNVLGNPTYIDCEMGEAYKIENGSIISLNNHIDLGSDLPKLAPGSNIVSVDSSITELKIAPRWWKV